MVILTIRKYDMLNPNKTTYWNLSQPQHTPEGRGLMKLYYETDLHHRLDNAVGYPHNGGKHTLRVRSTVSSLIDWLELVLSEMGEVIWPFVENCLKEIENWEEKQNEIDNG